MKNNALPEAGARLYSPKAIERVLLDRPKVQALPAAVAVYIVGAYWFTALTSFANPGVTIARLLSNAFAGIAPVDAPGFIVAQIAGTLLATALTRVLED